MIKKFEVEDIAKILTLEDTLANHFPCSRGEWVQWLISQADNPKINVIGDIVDNQIVGYMVLVNNVMPPVFNTCACLFVWSKTHRITLNLVAEGKLWKEAIGAQKGVIVVPLSHSEKYMQSFEGRLVANVFEF